MKLIFQATILFLIQQVMAAKHFKKDPFLPAFSFLGFSDLDSIDLTFGFFEGVLERDVRAEYLKCYKSESISKVFAAFWKVGIFSIVPGLIWNTVTGKVDPDIAKLLTDECQRPFTDVSGILMYEREKALGMSSSMSSFSFGSYFAPITGLFTYGPQLFTSFFAHDFYEFGRIVGVYVVSINK